MLLTSMSNSADALHHVFQPATAPGCFPSGSKTKRRGLSDVTNFSTATVLSTSSLQPKRDASDDATSAMAIDATTDDMQPWHNANSVMQPFHQPVPAPIAKASVPSWNSSDEELEIFNNLRRRESSCRIDVDYYEAKMQPHLNCKMRAVLVDWLIEVHRRSKLHNETLYLMVHYVDRFLSKRVIHRNQLQLVGITAMLIASKMDEVFAIEVADLVYVTDNAYTAQQVLDCEIEMLIQLNFQLSVPTTSSFLGFLLQRLVCAPVTCHFATFFSQACLLEFSICRAYKPSQTAASCVVLALAASCCDEMPVGCDSGDQDSLHELLMQSRRPQLEHLMQLCECRLEELRECAQSILELLLSIPLCKLVAVQDKFGGKKYGAVSQRNLVALRQLFL